MADPVTIGRPSRQRVTRGALALILGAAVLGGCTIAGVPNPWLLLTLGAVATVAWLLDGSSQRYLGPGLLALVAGIGIVLGNELGMDPRKAEHSLVYGGFGLALLTMSYFNPMAARAGGAFLLYTGLTVGLIDISMGWWLTGILVIWGVYWLVRAQRGDGLPQPALDEAQASRATSSSERRTLIGSRS